MDKLNLAFEFVGGALAKLTELLFMFLALAIVGQLLFAQPIFGMDVIGNVLVLIEKFGQAGFVGVLAVIALYALVTRKAG